MNDQFIAKFTDISIPTRLSVMVEGYQLLTEMRKNSIEVWAIPEQMNRLKKELRETTMVHEAYEKKRNRWQHELKHK